MSVSGGHRLVVDHSWTRLLVSVWTQHPQPPIKSPSKTPINRLNQPKLGWFRRFMGVLEVIYIYIYKSPAVTETRCSLAVFGGGPGSEVPTLRRTCRSGSWCSAPSSSANRRASKSPRATTAARRTRQSCREDDPPPAGWHPAGWVPQSSECWFFHISHVPWSNGRMLFQQSSRIMLIEMLENLVPWSVGDGLWCPSWGIPDTYHEHIMGIKSISGWWLTYPSEKWWS